MLVRLMYCSRAATGVDSEELSLLLRQCRSHNGEAGITGMLCFSEGLFIQVIEGGRSGVNQLYQRILADPRHHDVVLLVYDEISQRRFAGWMMGQVNMARVNTAMLLKYSERPSLDPYSVSGRVTLALFEELLATAAVVGDR
ncbi:MAG: BLUF domain-containing protein [Betaproteobacteria bacterium]|nr:BLUF domain-containing protein [Betaproteobacteria bacterium]